MTRFETWAPVSTFRTSVRRQPLDAANGRNVTTEAVTSRPRSSITRVLFDVFGTIAIALLVPIFVVALPFALIWRAILQTARSRHSERVATNSLTEPAWPRWSVWK